MRVLATIGFSFSAGVFLAALLPWNGWQLYAAGGVLLLALAWLFAARKQNIFAGDCCSCCRWRYRWPILPGMTTWCASR